MPKLLSVETVTAVPRTGAPALDAYLATVEPRNYRILHFDDGTVLHTSSPRDLAAVNADLVRSVVEFGRPLHALAAMAHGDAPVSL